MGKKLGRALQETHESPDQYVFHASDDFHHSEWIRIKVGTDVLRAIEEVKSSGKHPYRTESDVIRDSLFHRLAWLQVNGNPRLAETVRSMKRMHLLNAFAAGEQEVSKWVEELEKNMSSPKLSEQKRFTLIQEMYDVIQAMSDDNEDKEVWMKLLKERYPKYCPQGFDMSRLVE